MQFAHISDTHLGVRQFDCEQREQDIYDAFLEAVDKIVEERVDFVLHTGDLFEHSKPPIKAIVVAQEGFKKLSEAGIPVYIIPGNHEMPKRKGNLCPIEVFRDDVHIIDGNYHIIGDIFIGGIAYYPRVFSDQIRDQLLKLARDAAGSPRKILMLHQGIREHMYPIEGSYELELHEIPTGFDYYAMGHMHRRRIRDYGGGYLSYPGSTEYMTVSEYEEGGEDKKGFLLIDTSGDQLSIKDVDLDTRRLIKKSVAVKIPQELYEPLGDVLAIANTLDSPPLVWLKIRHQGCDQLKLRQRINEILKDKSVYTKVEFEDLSIYGPVGGLDHCADVAEVMRELLKDKYDETDIAFAVSLVDALSTGDEEGALALSIDHYGRRNK